MSVISVKETHEGREGDLTADSASLRRVFLVRTDDVRDGALTVRDAAGIPALYSTYFDGTTANASYIAKRKTATNLDGSQKAWRVEVEYETLNSDTGSEASLLPQLRPAEYTWATGSAQQEMLIDKLAQPVKNSVGDPFDPPVERNNSYRILTIVRNELSFSGYDTDAYVDTLNSAPIFGYDAAEGRIDSIDATVEYDANYGAYWRVTYVIHFRKTAQWAPTIASNRRLQISSGTISTGATAPGPWDVTRRNIGTRYKKTSGSTKANMAKDDAGIYVSDPIDLADDGTRNDDPGDTPYYWIFFPYARASWAPLRLDY
jgi:hypothetical protein